MNKINIQLVVLLFAFVIAGLMPTAMAANLTLVLNNTIDGTSTPLINNATNITSATLLDINGNPQGTATLGANNMTAMFDMSAGVNPGHYFIEVNNIAGALVPTRIDSNASDITQTVGRRLRNSYIGDASSPDYRIKSYPSAISSSHPVVNFASGANESKNAFVIVPGASNMIEVRVLNTDELLSNFSSSSGNLHDSTATSFQTWILGDTPGAVAGTFTGNNGHLGNATDNSSCIGCHTNLGTKPATFSAIATTNGWCFRCHNGPGGPSQGFIDPAIIIPPPTGGFNVSGFSLNNSDNTGLQGWTINISNGTINMQDETDVNGSYMFSGISNGTYTLTENPMTNWTNVSPSTVEVTVDGADLPDQNFTNMPKIVEVLPYVVSGFKLNSSDNTGLQGWTINISNDTINMQGVTDVNGSYMFSGISNGTYNITENPMTGWTNVSPSTIEVTVNGADLPNQNFTNILMAQPPVNAEVAYIVIVPYSVSLHTGEELQFHAQAYDANDTKIDANISYVIKNNQSNVGTITESGLFSAVKSGSVRITASSGDISDTAVVTVTNIDHRNRHGNRHHNSGGWQEYIGAVN